MSEEDDYESIRLSAMLNGERAGYARMKKEQEGGATAAVRDVIDTAMDADPEWPPGSDSAEGETEDSVQSTRDDSGDLPESSDAEESQLARRDAEPDHRVARVDGDYVDIDVNNPESKLYRDPKDVALAPKEAENWTDFGAVGGQWDKNRREVIAAHLAWVARESRGAVMALNRMEIQEALEDNLGLARSTVQNYLPRVTNEILYPHPATPDGVLTDRLLNDIRLALAGYHDRGNAERALDKDERHRYPDDWQELLSGYDKFVKEVYYLREEDYLDELSDAMRKALTMVAAINKEYDGGDHLTMTGEENASAWKLVADEMETELRQSLDEWRTGETINGMTYSSAYNLLAARARQLPGKREDAPEDYRQWEDDLMEFVQDVEQIIERQKQSGDVDGSVSHDMDVDEALDTLELGNKSLAELSVEDVENQHSKLSKERHPDVNGEDDGGSGIDWTEEMKDLNVARDSLKERLEQSGSGSGIGVSA